MRAFLSIGSNLGGRITNCRRAILRLSECGDIIVTGRSGFYKTMPWGKAPGPDFVNCAVSVETRLGPLELLCLLKSIEREMGRSVGGSFSSRIIDIDIIFYGDGAVRVRGLIVPHPLMAERAFVLSPLVEIAPDYVHPILKIDVKTLLKRLKDKGTVKALDVLTPHV